MLVTMLESESIANGFNIPGAKLLPCVGASTQQLLQAVGCLTLPHLDSFFRLLLCIFHANDSRPAVEQPEVVSEYTW